MGLALALSGDAADRHLARSIAAFVYDTSAIEPAPARRPTPEMAPQPKLPDIGLQR